MATEEKQNEWIRQEYRKLVNYVRGLVGTVAEMDAEDFVQDVLVRLTELANPALPLEHLAAYVYRALRNRVIDFFRVRKKNVALADGEAWGGLYAVLQDHRANALDQMDGHDMESHLYKALQQLKPVERAVIVANELEGLGFRELSRLWAIPVNTLLSHKARALKKLKRELGSLDKEE